MTLKLQHIEFHFRDDKSHDVKVVFTETTAPAGKAGLYYDAKVFKAGEEIGGFLTQAFANKTNARQLATTALSNPVA